MHQDAMNFVEWLRQQLESRDWSQVDLVNSARARGYSITAPQVSRILNREQEAGVSAVIAIAHGLGIPREEAFRARGWLLPNPEETIDTNPLLADLVQKIRQLPEYLQNTTVTTLLSVLDLVQKSFKPNDKPDSIDET